MANVINKLESKINNDLSQTLRPYNERNFIFTTTGLNGRSSTNQKLIIKEMSAFFWQKNLEAQESVNGIQGVTTAQKEAFKDRCINLSKISITLTRLGYYEDYERFYILLKKYIKEPMDTRTKIDCITELYLAIENILNAYINSCLVFLKAKNNVTDSDIREATIIPIEVGTEKIREKAFKDIVLDLKKEVENNYSK